MKPAPFEYLRPKTTDEALALLARHRDEARILAGGQSLVPMLNFRVARFDYLVDINELSELSFIAVRNRTLHVGALTRYRDIETSPVVASAAPLLQEATRSVAHLPVRTRGTIGGSLAHADPAAEYAAVMLALDARLLLRSAGSERLLATGDFIKGMFSTALEPDEMLLEVQIPVARPDQVFGFEEYSRRPGDLAVIGIAARLDLRDTRVESARVVGFGLAGGACRIAEAEAELMGNECTAERIERAGRAATNVPAHTDIHATAALRQHLASVLTKRALQKALTSRRAAGP